MITKGGWIDRGYFKSRYAELDSIRKTDPDRAEILEKEIKDEWKSFAEVDNPPDTVKVENQKCSNCGHEGEYERHCWNCPVVIINGRGNWVPKDDAIAGQKGQED